MTISDVAVNYKLEKGKKYFDEIPEYEIFSFKKSRLRMLARCQLKTYLKKAKRQPGRRSVYYAQINKVILHESLLKIAKFNFIQGKT